MFFTKIFVSVLAALGLPTTVLASPVAQPFSKRADDILTTVQGVSDGIAPLTSALATATATADVSAAVDAIVNVFAVAHVKLLSLVNVDITADVDVIAKLNIDLIVNLLATLSIHNLLDLTLFAKIDAALSVYLAVLVVIHADIAMQIGEGIPFLDINIFVILKLVLTAKVLGLVNILGL